MTSVISANSNPFDAIASAPQPLTKKTVEQALAGAPAEIRSAVRPEVVYRDLKQILTTGVFGDKAPKLADDLAAEVASLAPATQPSGYNATATAFAEVLTAPLAGGAIYKNAYLLSAMVTGAVVALESDLAAKTPEQKADKAALIEAFKNGIAGPSTLQTFAGLWAALASQQPAGDGTFILPRETASAIVASIKAGEVNDELKAILQAKLAPGGATSQATPEQIAARRAQLERESTRPIGGKTEAQLEALYREVADKADIARIAYRPETFRPGKYQKLLTAVEQSPLTQILKPILIELIGRYNISTRRAQKANYTEISAANAANVNDKQLQAVYKTAQSVAERMGAGSPSVTRVAQDVLNAWVSSVDIENPHITYFSYLQDIVWDGAKQDWIKFHVDANDEFCDADAPGAKEISGERLVEVVFAHELMHIFEGAVLNQYLLAVLLGVSLDSDASLHEGGCLCSSCGAIAERVDLASKVLGDGDIQKFLTNDAHNDLRLKVASHPELNAEFNVEKAVATQLRLNTLRASGAKLTPEQEAEAKASASALGAFFQMFTRLGESTADYGAMRILGPDAPRWMAMTFDIVARTAGKGSPEERRAALMESYKRDHRGEAKERLHYSEEGGAISHAQFATATTHPTRILRALGNYRHAERKETQAVWAFANQPARIRLLGAAHAVESEINRREDAHADFQHGSARDKAAEEPEEILKVLEDAHAEKAIAKQTERMRIVTSEIAKLVFADGLETEGGRIPYAITVGQFMKANGEPIFREQAEANPLAALLGGGGPTEAPACAKMAKQLAEELEKIVAGSELSEEARKAWASVVGAYRTIAQGEQVGAEARIARTKGKSVMRTMRRDA